MPLFASVHCGPAADLVPGLLPKLPLRTWKFMNQLITSSASCSVSIFGATNASCVYLHRLLNSIKLVLDKEADIDTCKTVVASQQVV